MLPRIIQHSTHTMTVLFAEDEVARLKDHLACISEAGSVSACGIGTQVSIDRQIQLETFYITSIRANSLVVLERARKSSDEADSAMLTSAMVLDRADRCGAIVLNCTNPEPTVQFETNGAAVNAISAQLTVAYKTRTTILDLATKNWFRVTADTFPIGKRVRIGGMKTAKWNGCTGSIVASAACALGRLAVRTSATRTILSVDSVHLTPL